MYFHELLSELKGLNAQWKNQDFRYTKEQQQRYDMLIELRRARVNYFYENNLVSKGNKTSTTNK